MRAEPVGREEIFHLRKKRIELLIDVFSAIFVSSFGAIVADRHFAFEDLHLLLRYLGIFYNPILPLFPLFLPGCKLCELIVGPQMLSQTTSLLCICCIPPMIILRPWTDSGNSMDDGKKTSILSFHIFRRRWSFSPLMASTIYLSNQRHHFYTYYCLFTV